MKNAILSVGAEGAVGAVRNLLGDLLTKGLVEAILVPKELPSKDNVVQSLATTVAALDAANPLAPVLPVTTARIISDMTKVAPSQKKIGVVARSCELRALTELVKLKQVSPDNLILIGIDCLGTYTVKEYGEVSQGNPSFTEEFLKSSKEDKSDNHLREACQACEYPYPLNADITLGLFGMDYAKELLIIANTPQGEEILAGLEMAEGPGTEAREAAISKLASVKAKKRDELFGQTQKENTGLESLSATFARCIGCHNCRDMCPLCYCKECVFDSPTFEFEADKYLGWASKKGSLRMPTDTLLFHLTRLNHMVASCVGCGLCQEACPNDIPVFRIFRMVGDQVQSTFDYVPGRSLDDELPLTIFREDELQQVGYE